jgi:cobalt-zinc-cadmium efflux system protein
MTLAYMGAEVAGGLSSGSLALLADAGHLLTDAGALALSLLAMWFASRPATPQRSFGYYRFEILAALSNGAALVAIAAWIVMEAAGRLSEPAAVHSPLMMAVALGGLIVNLAGILLLHGKAHGSLNVRRTLAHVVGDALGSVGTPVLSVRTGTLVDSVESACPSLGPVEGIHVTHR